MKLHKINRPYRLCSDLRKCLIMSPAQKGQAAGCVVTKEDTPIVIASLTCAFAYCIYGASYASLSAALPALAEALDVSDADLGIAYSARGGGSLLGTIIAAYILNIPNFSLPKSLMTCVALALAGVMLIIIAVSKNYSVMMVLFAIQGLGFGGVDMMANCALPEMWGLRAQPWMQAMHTLFGVGCIIGPALVGALDYKVSFLIIAFACFLPCGMLFLGFMWNTATGNKYAPNNPDNAENDKLLHSSLLDDSEAATHHHNVNNIDVRVASVDSSRESFNKERGSFNAKERKHSTAIENQRLSLDLTFQDTAPNPAVDEREVYFVPPSIKYLTAIFYVIYMGFSSGYSFWITTYALNVNVTSSQSEAAYLISYYWATMTIGRLLAIVVAVHTTATKMIRIKLIQCIGAAIFLLIVATKSYLWLVAATIACAFAQSSIFPLAMTVLTDYGFTLDASATTLFMTGVTLGDSVLPVIVGFIMDGGGDAAFLYTLASFCGILVVVYLTVNYMSSFPSMFVEAAPTAVENESLERGSEVKNVIGNRE